MKNLGNALAKIPVSTASVIAKTSAVLPWAEDHWQMKVLSQDLYWNDEFPQNEDLPAKQVQQKHRNELIYYEQILAPACRQAG